MRSVGTRVLCGLAVALSAVMSVGAQERPAAVEKADPRIGLKGGFRDAGQASSNLELIASLPRPEGFFDPKAPAGEPVPPEKDPETEKKEEE